MATQSARSDRVSAPARNGRRRLSPWTVTQPWTPRTRPPLLGKRADAFPTPPTAVHGVAKSKKSDPRLRAGKESDNTHGTYREAAFQTFLNGRI